MPDQPIAGNGIGDGNEEQDQSGHREHGIDRQSTGLQHDSGIEDHRHQNPAGNDAEGGPIHKDRDDDAQIAVFVGDAALQAVHRAADLDHAGKARDGARNQHGDEDTVRDADPGIFRSAPVRARHADLIAPPAVSQDKA